MLAFNWKCFIVEFPMNNISLILHQKHQLDVPMECIQLKISWFCLPIKTISGLDLLISTSVETVVFGKGHKSPAMLNMHFGDFIRIFIIRKVLYSWPQYKQVKLRSFPNPFRVQLPIQYIKISKPVISPKNCLKYV